MDHTLIAYSLDRTCSTYLTERFFRRSVLCEASCLHYLLPDKRDSLVTDRLRHAKTYFEFELIPLPGNKLINFGILFSPIACDISTNLSPVLYWWLWNKSFVQKRSGERIIVDRPIP